MTIKQASFNGGDLEKILSGLKNVRVCVLGDVCLDIYWYADMKRSRLSRETPHFPLPIVSESYAPGGCGNVINNICALGVRELIPISMVGSDWRGFLLGKWFEQKKLDVSFLLKSDDKITPCYCKPIRTGISQTAYEDPRLDFENFTEITQQDEDKIISFLEQAAPRVDVIVVSDQYRYGIITKRVREKLAELGRAGAAVIVDSRERVMEYRDVIVKPNEVESAAAVGVDTAGGEVTATLYAPIASELYRRNKKPVVVTLGEKGALWCDESGITYAPTEKAEPPTDIVGAGDTFLSAFCCAQAAGAGGGAALAFANLASGVTVKKLGATGTASPEEIRRQFAARGERPH